MVKESRTPFDVTLDKAVEHHRELKSMPRRMLTSRAFLNQVMTIAGCDEDRIDEVDQLLSERPDADGCLRFVSGVVRSHRSGNYPEAYSQIDKLVRVLSDQATTAASANALGVSLPELYGVAIKRLAQMRPNVFGIWDDLDEYDQKFNKLRSQLDDCYEKLREEFSGADVVIDLNDGELNDEQRRRGLVRATFRRAPQVNMQGPDWPARLVRAVSSQKEVTEEPSTDKKKRSKRRLKMQQQEPQLSV